MSFLLTRGQINPVVNYYYEDGARQRFGLRHGLVAFATVLLCMLVILAKVVSSNVQLVSAESQLTTATGGDSSHNNSNIPALATNQLQTDIDQWLQGHQQSQWGISVQALDGSLAAKSHDEDVFTLASVYKLFLLQPLAAKIPSSQWSSTLIESQTYDDCVDKMLRISDNACAEAIGTHLGWNIAEKYLRSLGYSKTAFVGPTTTGTANETAALIQNLYNGEGFDSTTRAKALDAMVSPKKNEGIRRGCDGCTVYNKIGDIDGYRNDVAIIVKDGKVYSLVIFSKGGTWQQITELTKTISTHF